SSTTTRGAIAAAATDLPSRRHLCRRLPSERRTSLFFWSTIRSCKLSYESKNLKLPN
ncbi:hypothetical protein LINPERPRIM_LOCUS30431, partial [Linum perenne]